MPVVLDAQSPVPPQRDSVGVRRDSLFGLLPPVEVTVTRSGAVSRLLVPYAVHGLRVGESLPVASLENALVAVPGVSVSSRNNPTQDPRLSIRGFGSRSAFGVRGVRVLQDGMPVTLPDGQTPIDYLDFESVGRIELIRGSASALYGNAAGGVVNLISREGAPPSGASIRLLSAEGGLSRVVAEGAGKGGGLRIAGTLSRTDDAGFREHSSHRATRANIRASYVHGATRLRAQFLGFALPRAENPGSLTREQMSLDRTMAEPLAVTRDAGKTVAQTQIGITLTSALSGTEIDAQVYGGRRGLHNPLTFAVINLDRTSGGLSFRATRRLTVGRLTGMTIGIDAQQQEDDRVERENCVGIPAASVSCPAPGARTGALRREQGERVSSVGPYASVEIVPNRRHRFTAGIRADVVLFDVRDRLITATNPDESGRRVMRATSPQIGYVALLPRGTALYANYSTAFETPTATELGNKSDGTAGVNDDLQPQRAKTWEVGLKGGAAGQLEYDIAAFRTGVSQELIPFENPATPGRRFFRNAGKATRRGIEFGLAARRSHLDLMSAITYSDFRFGEYNTATADFSGKAIPGIPRWTGQASLTWRAARLQAVLDAKLTSKAFVDDANSATVAGYAVFDWRLSTEIRRGAMTLRPLVAVNNLLNRDYVGSVVVNAAGGRYYEPAQGRRLLGGATVGF